MGRKAGCASEGHAIGRWGRARREVPGDGSEPAWGREHERSVDDDYIDRGRGEVGSERGELAADDRLRCRGRRWSCLGWWAVRHSLSASRRNVCWRCGANGHSHRPRRKLPFNLNFAPTHPTLPILTDPSIALRPESSHLCLRTESLSMVSFLTWNLFASMAPHLHTRPIRIETLESWLTRKDSTGL